MPKKSRFIEINDMIIPDGALGGHTPLHRCHLSQEETEIGKASLAKNPAGYDGKGHTLIVGHNPYVYRHGDEPKARCSFCSWVVSDECQEWLDKCVT